MMVLNPFIVFLGFLICTIVVSDSELVRDKKKSLGHGEVIRKIGCSTTDIPCRSPEGIHRGHVGNHLARGDTLGSHDRIKVSIKKNLGGVFGADYDHIGENTNTNTNTNSNYNNANNNGNDKCIGNCVSTDNNSNNRIGNDKGNSNNNGSTNRNGNVSSTDSDSTNNNNNDSNMNMGYGIRIDPINGLGMGMGINIHYWNETLGRGWENDEVESQI